MKKYLLLIAVVFLPALCTASNSLSELDRTGTAFVAPKFGFTFPVGALSDANYQLIASSWRKEGITLTGEFGYFITNSIVGGLEISYSNFHPKNISIFPDDRVDESRVRIRRVGIYLQYFMISTGKYRPFMKLGLGLFEASRISMPTKTGDVIEYKDYSLGAKPVFLGGGGIQANITPKFSVSFSIEAVSLNSFSSAWETSGATVGPLHTNMLFFPVYFGIIYHLNEN
ncbi:MAG: hypothetical protein WBP29_07945 [Candidatus Zixiibacteriota bacterium]